MVGQAFVPCRGRAKFQELVMREPIIVLITVDLYVYIYIVYIYITIMIVLDIQLNYIQPIDILVLDTYSYSIAFLLHQLGISASRRSGCYGSNRRACALPRRT